MPRVFDDSTLRILNPQKATMYSYLIPYALAVCRDSRTFAQSRLRRAFLFRGWPPNYGRTIYFDPHRDVCAYLFTDLSWSASFIPGQCLFDHVEIIANGSPDFVQWVSAHIFTIQSLESFIRAARRKLKSTDKALAGNFETEWKEWDGVWGAYNKSLREGIAKLDADLNKEIDNIAQRDCLPLNERLKEIKQLRTSYKDKLGATIASLKGEISLSDEKREEYKTRFEEASTQLDAAPRAATAALPAATEQSPLENRIESLSQQWVT